jgi:hypothetical protein
VGTHVARFRMCRWQPDSPSHPLSPPLLRPFVCPVRALFLSVTVPASADTTGTTRDGGDD